MPSPDLRALLLVGASFALVACEPEQEGTPLEADRTHRQEQAVPANADNVATGAREAEQRVHVATGTIESVDARNQRITISHDPVESLGWPKMTMPFVATDAGMLRGLEDGARIRFKFHEGEEGQYVIENIERVPE